MCYEILPVKYDYNVYLWILEMLVQFTRLHCCIIHFCNVVTFMCTCNIRILVEDCDILQDHFIIFGKYVCITIFSQSSTTYVLILCNLFSKCYIIVACKSVSWDEVMHLFVFYLESECVCVSILLSYPCQRIHYRRHFCLFTFKLHTYFIKLFIKSC